VIEPYSAIQASLEAPMPGETSLFRFNLVANTGQVKCGLIQHGPRGDDKGATLAQLAFVQSRAVFA
jgi:hypothetical protein